jgi:hypothetical protein
MLRSPPVAQNDARYLTNSRDTTLGPVNTIRAAATGANFSECEEQGATNTGRIRATRDEAIGKIRPVPEGCGPNRAILRCRPRLGTCHSLRTPPRLARFWLATLLALIVLTGPSLLLTSSLGRDFDRRRAQIPRFRVRNDFYMPATSGRLGTKPAPCIRCTSNSRSAGPEFRVYRT